MLTMKRYNSACIATYANISNETKMMIEMTKNNIRFMNINNKQIKQMY